MSFGDKRFWVVVAGIIGSLITAVAGLVWLCTVVKP